MGYLFYNNFSLEDWQCVIDQLFCDKTEYEFIYSISCNSYTYGLPTIIEIYTEL